LLEIFLLKRLRVLREAEESINMAIAQITYESYVDGYHYAYDIGSYDVLTDIVTYNNLPYPIRVQYEMYQGQQVTVQVFKLC
jgi:hypothetical protein